MVRKTYKDAVAVHVAMNMGARTHVAIRVPDVNLANRDGAQEIIKDIAML